MTQRAFDRLCDSYGLQRAYESATGVEVRPSEAALRAVLSAMGVAADTEAAVEASLAQAPSAPEDDDVPKGARSYLPDWLAQGRVWGVTCQLYGVRSKRNHGIGDFEDLARLAERVAADGGDFVGVNPLHALFCADPERCSPFSPSNRVYLNPLYIALDAIPGIARQPDVDETHAEALRAAEWVDYAEVAALKLSVLRSCRDDLAANPALWSQEGHRAFDRFVERGGEDLRRHALFEALSLHFAPDHGAGWRGWPQEYRQPETEAVADFAAAHAHDVGFQLWLQWVADTQLADAARRAHEAGMRVGLYLDVAVGTAPDGSATWSDPDLVVPGANVGAPPDAFFTGGQDWGLAPFSPAALRRRDFAPLRAMLDAVARHAGAIRIDHAMSLTRLFWIPQGFAPTEGCFVRYPLPAMLKTLAEASTTHRTIVIGEDLGTVPKGFDAVMRDAELQSYRVLYFEWVRKAFRASASYKREAFVTVSTHDLPPFRGWLSGYDVDLFRELDLLDEEAAANRHKERVHDRKALVDRLRRDLPKRLVEPLAGPDLDPQDMAVAVHAFLARTPSRLLGVQLEDLCGAKRPVNVPGTWREYPNWRLRTPRPIEEAAESASWAEIIGAVARERPRAS